MLVLQVILIIVVTLLPGTLLLRLLKYKGDNLNKVLYASAFGVLFNMVVGIVANFAFGLNLLSVLSCYLVLLVGVGAVNLKYGELNIKWNGYKPLAIPFSIFIVSIILQLQTTLTSPNLVGSDIHLEYFISDMVIKQGFWNPMYMATYLNSCLGLTILLPVYKLLSGMTLMWVFKIICPLIFALLPVVLYKLFKMQFSTLVSVLAVVFFITMPIFTMDLVQLVRQQQSELFFVLVCLVVMDNDINIRQKIAIGLVFTTGVITTHIGIAVGFIGYLLGGFIFVITFSKLWKHKVDDARKTVLNKSILAILCIGAVCIYIGFYGFVFSGRMISSVTLPIEVAKNTVTSVVAGMEESENKISPPATFDKPSGLDEMVNKGEVEDINSQPSTLDEPSESDEAVNTEENKEVEDIDAQEISVKKVSFFKRFPFLDPLVKEPLAQTAIGLDFSEASTLGKGWRILQYLVEICLVVGFFKLLFRPPRNLRIEYMAFVIASFLVLVGIYILSTYGWGLGSVRVWGITLLFISPLFVIGCGTIGRWLVRLKSVSDGKMLLVSTLILLIPYYIFNSGLVFEVAKLQSVGFIDVPYSVALSGHRVDVASVFDEQDIEAMDWLKEQFLKDKQVIYADTHGCSLMVQKLFGDVEKGQFKYLWLMKNEDVGYVFLRKRNVDNEMLTLPGGYGARKSYSLNDYPIVKEKIENGVIIFDNGARVILVK